MYKEKEFKEYLVSDKNITPASVNAYVADIKDYCLYLDSKKYNPLACSADTIKAFLTTLKNLGRSRSTINRKMVSIRKYYDFLRFNGEISFNPCSKVIVPKVEAKDFQYLSIEQVDNLLKQPSDDEKGLRDKALLELLYACGLKVSELTALNVQDIDLRIGFVSCHGENTKNRIIPIGKMARIAILKYMKDIRTNLLAGKEDVGALFLNYNGERITRQGVWKIVKFYGKKAGISDNLSPQLIRNSFAAHMIENGADLKSLQELLGSEDMALTKLYFSLSKARVMDVYDKSHPRA